MSNAAKDFLKGAFGLIALFLVLTHSGGLARVIGAGTSGAGQDFKILQGRG